MSRVEGPAYAPGPATDFLRSKALADAERLVRSALGPKGRPAMICRTSPKEVTVTKVRQ